MSNLFARDLGQLVHPTRHRKSAFPTIRRIASRPLPPRVAPPPPPRARPGQGSQVPSPSTSSARRTMLALGATALRRAASSAIAPVGGATARLLHRSPSPSSPAAASSAPSSAGAAAAEDASVLASMPALGVVRHDWTTAQVEALYPPPAARPRLRRRLRAIARITTRGRCSSARSCPSRRAGARRRATTARSRRRGRRPRSSRRSG